MERFRATIEPVPGGGHYVAVPPSSAEAAGLEYRMRVRGTLAGKPAQAGFEAQSPAHKREHVKFVLEAKQAETRARRIAKTVETLAKVKPRTTVVKKAAKAPTKKPARR